MKTLRTLLLMLVILCNRSSAQTRSNDVASFDSLSLSDLMNIKLTVASISELTPRQSPAIISTLSAEEIQASGARDLMDILQLIPGFGFNVDVEGVVGLSIRGNWAHEGKVVLIIDGQEMNEGLYSTLQWGNHYPADQIDRIEIIRGPGSAMYGGYAAYAVINVITRHPDTKHELAANIGTSSTSNGVSYAHSSLYYGNKFSEDKSLAITADIKEGSRSQSTYTDVFGSSYNMRGQSGLNNYFFNVGARLGSVNLRAIADLYQLESRDEYQQIVSEKQQLHFNSYFFESSKEFQLKENWKVQAKLKYKNQTPWSMVSGDGSEGEPFKIRNERITATVRSTTELSEQVDFSTGLELFRDFSTNTIAGEYFQKTNSSVLKYDNGALFVQGLWKAKYLNLIAGLRYNSNSRFASTLVPRVGLTRQFGELHLKALYSRSFRSPSAQNIDLSAAIQPEKTDVIEIEAGYLFNSSTNVNMNVYWMSTQDPIIYYYDTISDFDAYTNSTLTGTRGMEIEFNHKKEKVIYRFSVSGYLANDADKNSIYSTPLNSYTHLGIPAVKFTGTVQFRLSNALQLQLNGIYESDKTGYVSVDENGENPLAKNFPSIFQGNLNLTYEFKRIPGLKLSAGVRNITNSQYWFVQPYNSYHGALPGMEREFICKLSFQRF